MAYVKISDPKIIDLSTIHQIVNVVNQHSDNITALTNNFGTNYVTSEGTVVDSISTEYQYDISSQQLIHGKTTLDGSSISQYWVTLATSGYYQIPVKFMGSGFVSAPTINVTMQLSSNPSGTHGYYFTNLHTWVSSVTTSGFNLNVRSYGLNSQWFSSGKIYANWTAIGPK